MLILIHSALLITAQGLAAEILNIAVSKRNPEHDSVADYFKKPIIITFQD